MPSVKSAYVPGGQCLDWGIGALGDGVKTGCIGALVEITREIDG